MKTPNIVYLPEEINAVAGVFLTTSDCDCKYVETDTYVKKYYSEDLIAEIKKKLHVRFDGWIIDIDEEDNDLYANDAIDNIISEVLKDE